jgi:hypothetical protein
MTSLSKHVRRGANCAKPVNNSFVQIQLLCSVEKKRVGTLFAVPNAMQTGFKIVNWNRGVVAIENVSGKTLAIRLQINGFDIESEAN